MAYGPRAPQLPKGPGHFTSDSSAFKKNAVAMSANRSANAKAAKDNAMARLATKRAQKAKLAKIGGGHGGGGGGHTRHSPANGRFVG